MALDKPDIAQIGEMIAAANTSLTTSLTTTLEAALAKQIAERIEAATTPLTQRLDDLAKAKPKPGDKPGPEPDDKPDPEPLPPVVAAMLDKVINPLKARIEAIDAEKARAEQSAKTAALVDTTLAAKRPNLRPEQRAVIAARIASMQPADEAAVLAGLDTLAKELSALGADVKPLLAEPKGEGGLPPAPTPQKAAVDAMVKARGRWKV